MLFGNNCLPVYSVGLFRLLLFGFQEEIQNSLCNGLSQIVHGGNGQCFFSGIGIRNFQRRCTTNGTYSVCGDLFIVVFLYEMFQRFAAGKVGIGVPGGTEQNIVLFKVGGFRRGVQLQKIAETIFFCSDFRIR